MANGDKKLIYTLVAQNEQYLKKLEQSEKQLARLERASGKSVSQIEKQFNSLGSRSVDSLNKFGKAANDNARSTGRAFGQLGYQVQDIAVQLQGGQNPLLILGQQGSQIASVFGPGGIVVGALLAVGAALGSAFLPALFKSTDALKTLEETTASVNKILKKTEENVVVLSDEFAKLARSSEVLGQSQIKIALQDITEALEESKKEVLELSKGLSPGELGGRFSRAALLIGILENKLDTGKISVVEFNEEINKIFTQVEGNSKAFKDTVKGISDISLKTEELIQLRDRLAGGGISDLSTEKELKLQEKQIELTKKLSDERVEAENKRISKLEDSFFSIQDSLRTEEELIRDSFNNRLGIVDEYARLFPALEQEASDTRLRLKQEFNQKMENLEKQRVDREQKMAQITLNSYNTILSTIGGFTQRLEGMLQEGSAAQKAFFVINQAIAATMAVVQGFQAGMATRVAFAGLAASTFNPAWIGVGEGIAKTQEFVGIATAGLIAGQTIASFEGGGFTGSGMRSGGMDGRGGKMAMLHPNEVVMDLNGKSSDSGWKVEVNNYGNNNVRSDIDDINKIIRIIVEEMGNQNSQSRMALHNTSTARPVGNR